jgi:hypothetical protein
MRTRRMMQSVVGVIFTVAVLGLIPAGCGDDRGTGPGDGSVGGLVFTRADSSRVVFPPSSATYVWCGEWESGEVPIPALHVMVVMPGPAQGYWWLRAVLRDVRTGQPLSFPNDFNWDEPEGAHIFLFDDPNELATDTDDSGGTITFHQLPCPSGSMVDFSIDAVLGSEYGDMPPVSARGRFTARVTAPPPGWERILARAGASR